MKIGSAVILALSAVSSSAFTTPKHVAISQQPPSYSTGPSDGRSSSKVVVMMAQIPLVEDWKILRDGAVYGTVTNHPTIEDGTPITTSPLADPDASADGKLVATTSGSKYKLGVSVATKNGKKAAAKKAPAKKPAVVAKKKVVVKPKPVKKEVAPKPVKKEVAVAPPPAPAPSGPSPAERMRLAKIEFDLNGKTIGDGKYLLCGKMFRSTSGKSQIYFAYKADEDGLPTGPKLTVKTSTNLDALERENTNYNKVTGGLFSGSFVKKIDFLPEANGRGFESSCALVLEAGERNLKSVREARMNQGLEGKAMRQAAVALAQCVQAMHSSGLVWTDLKAENFVVVSDSIGEGSIDGVKGIDLESCVPVRGPPIDYSPEACPPEFAEAFLSGYGAEFQVDYHYDIWSLGMLLYELSVGKSYFAGKSPSQITKTLRFTEFEADVGAVPDARLRDLIGQCLQRDPNKRPGIAQILLHPYFLTTGIGPISF